MLQQVVLITECSSSLSPIHYNMLGAMSKYISQVQLNTSPCRHLMTEALKSRHINPSNPYTHSHVTTSQNKPSVPRILRHSTETATKDYSDTERRAVKRLSAKHLEEICSGR